MKRNLFKIFAFAVVLTLLLSAIPSPSHVLAETPIDLFFSEYIEGSSFNKAVEIYNGTGAAVDLSTYIIELYSNGAASPSQSVALSGTLADGDVFVIAHGSADAAILAVADVISSSVINFNGDDALVLRNNGTVVDSFGQVGFDPGSEWPGGGQDDTLRRAETVCTGDTNPNDAFDASLEWVAFANNTFDGLGNHTSTCGGGSTVTDIFMSEYIEGSSYNKAIEIYNGTSSAVDLAAGLYTLELYSNGSSTASQTLALSGIIAAGDVYVLAHPSADAAILAEADITNGSVINFNGDDALVLRKNGVAIDAFGQIGVDPGSQWPGGGQDDTLRRAETICTGDTDPNDAFDASLEWVVFANNTFDGLGAHTSNCGGTTTAEPKINEFSASTTGTDVEYVEIFGSIDTDYSAYTVLEIEGDTTGAGVVDEIISLGTTDGNGLFLASLSANALENGTLSLLLVKNFTGAFGADLDTNNDGTFDVTPWDAIIDSVSVNDGGTGDTTYGAPVLSAYYDGLPYAPGGASRIPDGFDTDSPTDWVRNDFDLAGIPGYAGTLGPGEALNTPGTSNEVYVAPPEACGDQFTSIYAVQGNGAASPLVGLEVAIEGIVVGDFQNNASPDNGDLNGFHVQDPTGDGDPATSDGIFVYAPGGIDVSVGDAVRVRGSVSEYYGLTEIGASQIWVCSSGNSIAPTVLSLPVTSVDDFEAYEGMLVTFPQALIISEYFNFDRYGEIVLTSQRHLTPTAEFEPGVPSIQAAADFLLDKITLDDGRSVQNPDPAIHPNGSIFDLNNLFRGGDTVANVTGVMDYNFDLYRIQPTQGADYTPVNPRPTEPEVVGGTLKVVSMNTLNYFSTIDQGTSYWICGPAQNQECRGADTFDEFTRQRDKIIAAISVMNADVIGLLEIENNINDEAVQNLVDGLNTALGAGTYDYIHTGVIGTDAIKVAMIYKPATVSLVGNYAILDSSVDPRFIDIKNRPVLAQTFMDNTTGGIFTVAVNHLKSKGSDCNDVGDPDLGDGAGNCNITRTWAAQALVDWLATDPTGSGDSDFLIIGDLNSYDHEDPIDAIKAGSDDILGTADDYTDLVFQFQGEDAYSYVFDGQIGYLDYGLASANLLGQVTGVADWHVNADEPDLIDYDMSFKLPAQDALYASDPYRYSDHDPVIIGLNICDEITPVFDEVSVSPDTLWPANHKYVEVTATVVVSDNFDPNPVVTLVSITSSEADEGLGDGDTADDIVIIDDFHFELRAERSGVNKTGRTYTITYMVTDACNNSTTQEVTVFVPFSQRK
jgi:predicted extracellular nuclease